MATYAPPDFAHQPGSPLRVRQAVASDEPWLTRIDYDAWTPRSTRPRLEPATVPFFERSHGGDAHDVLVATLPESIVGFVVVDAGPHPGSDRIAHIAELAVDPLSRRRRVASSLLLAAALTARAADVGRTTATVPRSNTAAVALLTTSGFRPAAAPLVPIASASDEIDFHLRTTSTERLASRASDTRW